MLGTRARSLALAMLLLLGTMTVTPAVSAVGPNQNDMGMTSGDLPDNLSSPTSVPNLIFSGSVTGSGELVSGTDDTDLLRVALNSNEGLAAELSFASGDDFDLEILDTNQNSMAYSYFSNPEAVSTNSSFSNHGGMVYIAITAYSFAGTTQVHGPDRLEVHHRQQRWRWRLRQQQRRCATQPLHGQRHHDLGHP